MAHQLDSGLFVGRAAWHGLGTVVQEAPTMEQAIVMAGMNWTVEETLLDDVGCPGWKRLNRSDNGNLLHVCKQGWTVVQNSEAFSWFDPLISDGEVTLETAVSLYEGKRIAVLCKINAPAGDVVPGDSVEQYLLLFNSHDGTLSAGVKFTNVRVVCANTLGIATANDRGNFGGETKFTEKSFRAKHTQNVSANLEKARAAIDFQKRRWDETLIQYKAMADTRMNDDLFRRYLELCFESQMKGIKDRRPGETITAEHLGNFGQLNTNFHEGKGMDIPGVGGTVWAGFQAVTEFATHQQGKEQETRINSQWFGDGASLIRRAHTAAMTLVN